MLSRLGGRVLRPSARRLALAQQARRAGDDVATEEETNTGQTGIEQFLGQHIVERGASADHPDPGRAWKHEELEVKGYTDLRRIWFLCLKERNQLLSVELFYQMQSETLGEFPHPTRLDRVETTMRRIREVITERHDVATKVAFDEFQKRLSKNQYRYPAGPHPPPGYGETTRTLVCFTQQSLMPKDETDFERTPDQEYEALKARMEVVLNATVKNVVELSTRRAEARDERLDFVQNKLSLCSRGLINSYEDLKAGWVAELEDLTKRGPFMYHITLEGADADKVLASAEAEEDEVCLLTLAAEGADADGIHEKDFTDHEHLVFLPAPLPPTQQPDEFYKHIMAREDWFLQARTRLAPHTPQAFHQAPQGISPFSKRRRDEESSRAQLKFEYEGRTSTPFVDAPHAGTEILNRYNLPGEETR